MATGTEVVLVRHGETEWSRMGRHTSHTDVALTDTGRRQAIAIGERLRTQDFARVLTSPLSRARIAPRIPAAEGSSPPVSTTRKRPSIQSTTP